MTIISAEPEYAAFLLGRAIKFNDTVGLKLIEPTPLNKLLVSMKWKQGDLMGVLRFSVHYYNSGGQSVITCYTAYDYKLSEISLINLVNKKEYNEFTCSHLSFEYSGSSKDPAVPFLISVSKFDTEKEKIDYHYQAKNHQELGFATHADVI